MGIYATGINEVRKVDSHTEDLILSGPNPILLRNICDFFIMSKSWSERNNPAKVQDYKTKEENFASRNVKGKNPFKDRRVREALNLAIDREALRRSVMRGMSLPADLIVAPGVNGHSAELDRPLKPDLTKARKLPAAAGYPNGFAFQLNCPKNRYLNEEKICVAQVHAGQGRRQDAPCGRVDGDLRRPVLAAIIGPHADLGRRRQFQLWPRQRSQAGRTDRREIKTETDDSRRNAMIREALVRKRDEHLVLPLHHQLRPWATKKKKDTIRASDGRPKARLTSVR